MASQQIPPADISTGTGASIPVSIADGDTFVVPANVQMLAAVSPVMGYGSYIDVEPGGLFAVVGNP